MTRSVFKVLDASSLSGWVSLVVSTCLWDFVRAMLSLLEAWTFYSFPGCDGDETVLVFLKTIVLAFTLLRDDGPSASLSLGWEFEPTDVMVSSFSYALGSSFLR